MTTPSRGCHGGRARERMRRAPSEKRPHAAMEFNQVRYFLTLANTLNFTRAAESCNVTQPALTRAIQKLEDELGGLLFYREHNLTQLTELGQLMRPVLGELAARIKGFALSMQEASSPEIYGSLLEGALDAGLAVAEAFVPER